jgi:predicted Zn-dependent protease with MMP-like domain
VKRPDGLILPPSLADLERLADEAFDTIPAPFKERIGLGPLVVRVEDFPDEETVEEMELEDDFQILGLYRGTALPNQSASGGGAEVDMVFLYRRPILDYWCETGEDLAHVVRHVLIHEIGHHFGFSDDDMERLEAEAP